MNTCQTLSQRLFTSGISRPQTWVRGLDRRYRILKDFFELAPFWTYSEPR